MVVVVVGGLSDSSLVFVVCFGFGGGERYHYVTLAGLEFISVNYAGLESCLSGVKVLGLKA